MSQEPAAIPNITINTITLITIAPAMSRANAVNTCVHPGEEGRGRGRKTTTEGSYVAGAHRNSKYNNTHNNPNNHRFSDVTCQCGEYMCTRRRRRPRSRKEKRRRREAMPQEPAAIPYILINTITLIMMIIIAPAMSFANAVNTCVHTGTEGRARDRKTTKEEAYVAGAHRNPKYNNTHNNPNNSHRSSDVICQCGEYMSTPRRRRPSS